MAGKKKNQQFAASVQISMISLIRKAGSVWGGVLRDTLLLCEKQMEGCSCKWNVLSGVGLYPMCQIVAESLKKFIIRCRGFLILRGSGLVYIFLTLTDLTVSAG